MHANVARATPDVENDAGTEFDDHRYIVIKISAVGIEVVVNGSQSRVAKDSVRHRPRLPVVGAALESFMHGQSERQ